MGDVKKNHWGLWKGEKQALEKTTYFGIWAPPVQVKLKFASSLKPETGPVPLQEFNGEHEFTHHSRPEASLFALAW